MKVYLVFSHFPYEGHELLGVFNSKEKAQADVDERLKTKLHFEQIYWEEYEVS